jgi:hypothetical protein
MRLRGLGLLVALATAAAALAAPALAAPAWLAPKVVSGAKGAAESPQIATDADGDAVAVWRRYEEPGFYTVEAAIHPAGGAWGAPVPLGPKTETAFLPEVAMNPAGRAVAVWSQYDASAGAYVVDAASLPGVGSAWGVPVEISGPGEDYLYAQVAIDPAGEAVAVWTREEGAKNTIESATLSAAGAWAKPQELSDHERADEPAVGISDAGEAVAVWIHQEGADYRAQASSRPAGGTWSKPADLSKKGEAANAVDVAVDPAGEAVAVWEMELEGVIESATRPAGGAWGPAVEISAAENAELPQVAIGAGGQTAATWLRVNGVGNYTVRGATGAVGATWGTPVDLSGSGVVSEGGVAVETDGTTVAVYRAPGGASDEVLARRKPLGAAWSEPVALSPSTSSADSGEVVAAPGGGAVAVWARPEKPDKFIEAAAYDATGPLLRSLSIPASGVVGQLASFSVSPLDAWSTLGATSWSFGDGGSATGNAVSHAYSGAGTYAVTVTATDALGNARSASGRVEVAAPPFAGRAQTKRVLKVKKGKVLLPLSCAGGTLPCTGAARILASARPGHTAHASAKRKPRKATIAAAGFDVAAGQTRIVKLPLTRKGRRWLAAAGAKGLKAQLGGTGVVGRAVVLKPAAARHGRKHHKH